MQSRIEIDHAAHRNVDALVVLPTILKKKCKDILYECSGPVEHFRYIAIYICNFACYAKVLVRVDLLSNLLCIHITKLTTLKLTYS